MVDALISFTICTRSVLIQQSIEEGRKTDAEDDAIMMTMMMVVLRQTDWKWELFPLTSASRLTCRVCVSARTYIQRVSYVCKVHVAMLRTDMQTKKTHTHTRHPNSYWMFIPYVALAGCCIFLPSSRGVGSYRANAIARNGNRTHALTIEWKCAHERGLLVLRGGEQTQTHNLRTQIWIGVICIVSYRSWTYKHDGTYDPRIHIHTHIYYHISRVYHNHTSSLASKRQREERTFKPWRVCVVYVCVFVCALCR